MLELHCVCACLPVAARPFSCSHTLLSLSRTRAAVLAVCACVRACVSLSGTRSISNTKGSELPAWATSALIGKRNRILKRWCVFFLLFSDILLLVFMLNVFHFHEADDLVTASHLSFLIDLHRSSAPSFADVCVCVL